MEICTIGFTKHSAREFFGILRDEGIERLIDVRLNNVSQLAGFAKRDDLRYFLELHGIGYTHESRLLAPTADLLKAYRNREITWDDYEDRFFDLMARRRIESELSPEFFLSRSVLLCSEHTAVQCHRRLIVEYLDAHWPDVRALHLPRHGDQAT